MAEQHQESASRRWIKGAAWLAALALALLLGKYFWPEWPRSVALVTELQKIAGADEPSKSTVASLILVDYLETRANAENWSAIYWGCTFASAILSAIAALVLKLETLIKNEGAKKDLAALFAVAAALLITISTSGDFQRKWQANRIAAAELEREGYRFLKEDGANALAYLDPVGEIMLKRQYAIVGGSEKK